MNEPIWRNELPDKPGFWWLIEGGKRPRIIEVAWFTDSGSPAMFDTGILGRVHLRQFKNPRWCGPIEPPQD